MKLEIIKLYFFYMTIFLLIILNSSCKKYLDAKPNLDLEIPTTLNDLQALLDNSQYMNSKDPNISEISSDCNYSTYSNWTASPLNERQYYTWDVDAGISVDATWYNVYQEIFYSNTVLDNLPNIVDSSESAYSSIKGTALFFRGFSFYNLAQLFAPQYNQSNISSGLGIPLRLTSSVTDVTVRSTVEQTFTQIINDLTNAADLLPITTSFKTRPNKAAAFGMLARVYLTMQDYNHAEEYSDSCLNIDSTLINFSTLDSTAFDAFPIFNNEVLFHSMSLGSYIIYPDSYDVDSSLFLSYNFNDLRRPLYYLNNGDGTYSFIGCYGGASGPNNGSFFDGIATDEIYLIKAECEARIGSVSSAMHDLNTLLQTRWRLGTFIPYTAGNSADALIEILAERKKELVQRGVRWSDLRRLNQDPNFAITLSRNLNGTIYTLPANDPRYTILIPSAVIAATQIQQNPR